MHRRAANSRPYKSDTFRSRNCRGGPWSSRFFVKMCLFPGRSKPLPYDRIRWFSSIDCHTSDVGHWFAMTDFGVLRFVYRCTRWKIFRFVHSNDKRINKTTVSFFVGASIRRPHVNGEMHRRAANSRPYTAMTDSVDLAICLSLYQTGNFPFRTP